MKIAKIVQRYSSIVVLCFVAFFATLALVQAQSADQYRVYLPILGKPFMAGDRKIASADGMAQRYVPAGEFTMGQSKYNKRAVYLDAYWIDETEVTNAMYARCEAAGGCTRPVSTSSAAQDSYYGNAAFDNYPVITVDWFQSQAYCAWAGRQLPTEAQWEKAARGIDDRTHPWGEGIDETYLNYNGTTGDTTKVGSYPKGASPYGALDMAGNVWEWIADWHNSHYYATSPYANPTGPQVGTTRVLRSGAWNELWLIDKRYSLDPNNDKDNIGFRCSQSKQTPIQTPIATPTIAPTAGASQLSPTDGMVQRYVPAGNFTMGSDNGYDSERPVHTVYLDGYWIDETEVTNGMYARCVADGECTLPTQTNSETRPSYYGDAAFDNYPVITVDWFQSQMYCAWAGRKLPTEAQWEKAARGTDARIHPWGEGLDCTYTNYYDDANESYCNGDTTEVGSYPTGASPYGALDMAGNVSEWVADSYDSSYYAISPLRNPTGPAIRISRVRRGGSWMAYGRVINRNQFNPDYDTDDIGFRCSQD